MRCCRSAQALALESERYGHAAAAAAYGGAEAGQSAGSDLATRLAAQQMGTLAGMSRKVRLLHCMHNVHSRGDRCSHLPRQLLPSPDTITPFARFKVGGQMPSAVAAWRAIANHLPSTNSLGNHPRQT